MTGQPIRTPVPDLRAPWLRSQLAAIGVAVLFALIGANGTGALPLISRFGYWLILMVGGTLIAQAASSALRRTTRLNAWQEMLALIAAIMLPVTLMVWLITAAITGHAPQLADLPRFTPPVLVISIAMAVLNSQINRTPAQSHVFHDDRLVEPGSAFRERLALKYRHADIYALSAEDHYLRVYSSAGETLILMRLYDAIRELDGIEGSQTHRSWWVAREAVTEVQRRDGRPALVLKGGTTAPVSRNYAKALKGDGWL